MLFFAYSVVHDLIFQNAKDIFLLHRLVLQISVIWSFSKTVSRSDEYPAAVLQAPLQSSFRC